MEFCRKTPLLQNRRSNATSLVTCDQFIPFLFLLLTFFSRCAISHVVSRCFLTLSFYMVLRRRSRKLTLETGSSLHKKRGEVTFTSFWILKQFPFTQLYPLKTFTFHFKTFGRGSSLHVYIKVYSRY